jgi:hypothetical protein
MLDFTFRGLDGYKLNSLFDENLLSDISNPDMVAINFRKLHN